MSDIAKKYLASRQITAKAIERNGKEVEAVVVHLKAAMIYGEIKALEISLALVDNFLEKCSLNNKDRFNNTIAKKFLEIQLKKLSRDIDDSNSKSDG